MWQGCVPGWNDRTCVCVYIYVPVLSDHGCPLHWAPVPAAPGFWNALQGHGKSWIPGSGSHRSRSAGSFHSHWVILHIHSSCGKRFLISWLPGSCLWYGRSLILSEMFHLHNSSPGCWPASYGHRLSAGEGSVWYNSTYFLKAQ